MEKNIWKYLLLGLITGLLVFAAFASASGSEILAATSTRWPTATRRPTDTRWPTVMPRPTSTRWPTATRRFTDTRWPTATPTIVKTLLPTLTRTASHTRWPTTPPTLNHTRWPTVTPRPTSTRWPSQTSSPTRTSIFSPTFTPSPTGWQVYQNTAYGFQFFYPSDASITVRQEGYVQIHLTIVPGTNLVSKYLEVYWRNDDGICRGTYGGTVTNIIFNGYVFLREEGRDQGAGQVYEWISYSTRQGNACLSFNFILHSGNPDMYSPPVPLFDKAAESAIFTQVVRTFSMLPVAPTPSMTPDDTQTAPLPIRDFNTVVSGEFKLIGYMRCSDVANYQWDVEACNGESGGCWISRTPLFGTSYSGFLRWEANRYCGWNIP